MATLGLFHRVIVRDKDGRVISDTKLTPSSSYVLAFLVHICGAWRDTNKGATDVDNVVQNVQKPSGISDSNKRLYLAAADDDDNYGIVVGTGTTVPANNDYKLATQIAHGLGAGQLDYGAHGFTAPAVVGSNVDVVVNRTFYNGSGNSIVVKEIGIYCSSWDNVDADQHYYCIVHDLLITPITVANLQTIAVQYTLRTTV